MSRRSDVVALAGLLGTLVAGRAAQAPPSPTPAVSAVYNSTTVMARVGNTLYIGGAFDHVGPPTGSFAIVDATDATQKHRRAVGRLYGVGGVRRRWRLFALGSNGNGPNIVRHILSSGALDPAWPATVATGGSIEGLARDGTRLFVAGFFTQVNGIARAGIAALDVASGALLPWNANLDLPSVFKVFADGGVIYIHGNFASARPPNFYCRY